MNEQSKSVMKGKGAWQAWADYWSLNSSTIDGLFTGMLSVSVTCNRCKT